LRCIRSGVVAFWLVIFEDESKVLEVIGRHEVPKERRVTRSVIILQPSALSTLSGFKGAIAHLLRSRIGCTYLSIRQARYSLASLRHASSLVPRLDLMHFR
jgi:hypothetical protein